MIKMKKNRLIKKAAIFFLSFILVFSNSLILYADEIPEETEEIGIPEGEIPENGDQGAPDPEEEDPGDGNGGEEDPQVNEPEEEQNPQEPEESGSESDPQEEERQEEEKQEEKKEEEKKEEEKKEEEKVQVFKITTDHDVLSFGTVSTSDRPRPLSFQIKNEGSEEAVIGWSQTDSTGVFLLNMPQNVSIPLGPGNSIQGSVETVAKKLESGDYSTTLIFTDLNHQTSQAKIDVSLRVEKAGPVVTKVRVRPGSVDLKQGGEAEFTAVVEGENDPGTSVTWKIQGQNSSDTRISESGVLHVGSDETASSVTVIAVSDQNESFKDTAAAYIAKDKYIVNADVEPSDGGYVTGRGSFNGGERTTLTAVAEKGYKFDEWLDSDGNYVTDSASFTTEKITKDMRFKAVFRQSEYEIKVKSADKEKGKVKGGGFVERGESITIEATPNDGYVFDGWYEKNKLVSNEKKLKIKDVKKSHVFVAEFKKDSFVVKLTPYPAEGGKTEGGGKYKSGSEVNLRSTAAKGYHFKGYVLNNQIISTSENYKINKLDRDLSVTAYFEKDGAVNHLIKSGVANEGGVITPSGETPVTDGNSITYSIAPDNGYGVLMVSVDGKQIGAVSSFTFENVKGDHSISVAFAPKENSVNEVKMSKIITTAEADEIAVAKLKKAGKDEEGQVSKVITAAEYLKMLEEEAAKTEGDSETIVVPQEQNLIGMDDTEELPDVVDKYNPDTAVGVYQSLDITRETAEKLIDGGGDAILINEAYELGYLDVIINNELMVPGKEGEIINLENDHTVENLQEVIRACLTREEKLLLMEGRDVVVSFTISGAENPGEYEKKAMNGASGVSVDKYLYITLIKSVDGVPSIVEKLDTPMKITMMIPDEFKGSDTKFCIIRNHNGVVDVLEDLDDDPDTVTVMTDRFSPYALGHFSAGNTKIWFMVFFAGIALTIVIIFTYISMKDRRRKRRRA